MRVSFYRSLIKKNVQNSVLYFLSKFIIIIVNIFHQILKRMTENVQSFFLFFFFTYSLYISITVLLYLTKEKHNNENIFVMKFIHEKNDTFLSFRQLLERLTQFLTCLCNAKNCIVQNVSTLLFISI